MAQKPILYSMSNDKLKIVCDCDGIILNFATGFAQWHNETYKDFKIDENPDSYDFGLPAEYIYNRIKEFWYKPEFTSLDYMPGFSIDAFNHMVAHHDVYIISAVSSDFLDARLKNLEGLNISNDRIILTENKTSFIIDEVQPDICIEDSPSNIDKFTQNGIPTLYPTAALYTADINSEYSIPYDDWFDLLNTLHSLV